MARRKKFDKKTAQKYNVVHRSHEDSLFFDNDASAHVLVAQPKTGRELQEERKIYSAAELEKQLTKEELAAIRGNEGLAAQYGIFFDDSNYDYMQHLKPMGNTDSVFIAKEEKPEPKKNIEALFKEALPSETQRTVTHDTFENIPLELQGFQPEMDSRLREVLEALEDEAYIDEEAEEGDIFADLLGSGQVEEDEFYDDEEYDEWDLDNYDDEFEGYESEDVEVVNPYNAGEAPEQAVNVVSTGWERDFEKFKSATKNAENDWDSDNEFEDEEDVVGELPTVAGKKKKNRIRKKMGAMTDTTSFSMTSSALFRTEGLTLLDDRYEQLAKKFEAEDEEPEHKEFDMNLERQDFEGMLDDFLDNYELEKGGRRLVKKDTKIQAIKDAADSVSKTKLAARRKKETGALMNSSFRNMRI